MSWRSRGWWTTRSLRDAETLHQLSDPFIAWPENTPSLSAGRVPKSCLRLSVGAGSCDARGSSTVPLIDHVGPPPGRRFWRRRGELLGERGERAFAALGHVLDHSVAPRTPALGCAELINVGCWSSRPVLPRGRRPRATAGRGPAGSRRTASSSTSRRECGCRRATHLLGIVLMHMHGFDNIANARTVRCHLAPARPRSMSAD